MHGPVHDATPDLPDRARAHHHDEVAVSANCFQLFHDRPEGVDVHRRSSVISQSFNEISRGDQTSLFLAVSDEVDSWHEYQVCLGETMCKLFEEKTSSTVLVWLVVLTRHAWWRLLYQQCAACRCKRRANVSLSSMLDAQLLGGSE